MGYGYVVWCHFTIIRGLSIGESKVDPGLQNGTCARVTIDTNPDGGSSALFARRSRGGESARNRCECSLLKQKGWNQAFMVDEINDKRCP